MAKQDTVIGLDIGKAAVKAVWVKLKGASPTVTRVEQLTLPQDGSDGKALIASWAQKVGLGQHPCCMGLSGQQTMFQPFVLPPGDPRTVEQAAAMEVIRFNEMAGEDMIFDLTPFAFNPAERRLLVAMARPTVVDQRVAFAEDVGVAIANVIPTPVAVFNALESAGPPHDEPYVYVNVGGSTTEVAIGSSVGLMFARTFSSGGRMFTDALAKAGGFAASRAEDMKLKEGFLPDPGEAQTESPLMAVADMWIQELQSCLSVHKSLFSERRAQPVKLVFTGGGSRLRGFPEYVGRKIGLEAVTSSVLPGLKSESDAAVYSAAFGLALTELTGAPIDVSLLPERMREELLLREQKPQWIAASVVAALILAVSLVGGYRDAKRRESVLGRQRGSLRHRQELVQQIEAVKAGNRQLFEMARPVIDLLRAAPLMRDMIALVAANKNENDQITMICDSDTYFGTNPLEPPQEEETVDGHRRRLTPPKKKSPRGAPDEGGVTNRVIESVVIEGYTRQYNFSTVKQLIAALSASDKVASADLLSDDKLVDTEEEGDRGLRRDRRFVIEVKVAMP